MNSGKVQIENTNEHNTTAKGEVTITDSYKWLFIGLIIIAFLNLIMLVYNATILETRLHNLEEKIGHSTSGG